MVYVGSKRKQAQYILPLILKNRKPGQYYVEPFAGGCNTLCLVDGKRIGNDSNRYLIAMWKKLLEGWQPNHTTEPEYKMLRNGKDFYPDHLIGWAGFVHSYRSIFFGGYSSAKTAIQHANNILRQIDQLRGVEFHSGSYADLKIPAKSIIYCDPPYAMTTEYHDDGFDHRAFWDWCRKMVKAGHEVFVSEYSAPADFVSIWSKTRVTGLGNKSNRGILQTERLFIHQSKLK